MSKPDDDGESEWISEDCCDIDPGPYVPPTEKGDAWCAATLGEGEEFYMGVNVEDGAVVPIIPCEYYATMEECEDQSFSCDEAIGHCGTPGTDSFVEDCAWATDIVTDTCCQAEQVSAREDNPRERRERRCCFHPFATERAKGADVQLLPLRDRSGAASARRDPLFTTGLLSSLNSREQWAAHVAYLSPPPPPPSDLPAAAPS